MAVTVNVVVGKYNTSMQFNVPRENVLVYWPQSHRILVILYFYSKIINQNYKKKYSSNLTALIININSTYRLIKREIVTGQYNSRAGISNVINPARGYISWWAWQVKLEKKNSEQYWITNIKWNLVLEHNIVYSSILDFTLSFLLVTMVCHWWGI